MSKIRLIHLCLPCLLLALIIMSGCKEGTPVPVLGCMDSGAVNFNPAAQVSDGTCIFPEFQVNFNYHLDNQPFYFDSIYNLGVGKHWVKLSVVKFYTSNYQLENATGKTETIDNSFELISPNTTQYKIGKTKVGNYKSLSFDIGVDENNNARLPSTFPVGHALNSNEMYVNDEQGFLFVKVRGTVDTDFDGLFSFPVELDLGMIDLLRTPSFDIDLNVKEQNAESNVIDININLAKLFESIDLSVNYRFNYLNNPSLSEQVMNDFVESLEKE